MYLLGILIARVLRIQKTLTLGFMSLILYMEMIGIFGLVRKCTKEKGIAYALVHQKTK